GFRPNPGAAYSFQWNSPPSGVPVDYRSLIEPPGAGRSGSASLEVRRFGTLAEYSQATKQDLHSVILDYDVFMNVPRLDAQDLKNVQKLYNAADLDFRLKPGSAAIGRGVILPNVTDGFSGQAPD